MKFSNELYIKKCVDRNGIDSPLSIQKIVDEKLIEFQIVSKRRMIN